MINPTHGAQAQGRHGGRTLARTLMLAALAASPAAFAGEPGNASKGNASQSVNAYQDRDFTAADRNGDGQLDRNEYDAMRNDALRRHQEEQLSRNDSHPGMSRNDGADAPAPGEGAPATEHQANVLRNFDEHDRDGDGYVSFEEFDRQASKD